MKQNVTIRIAAATLTLMVMPLIGRPQEPQTVDELIEQMAAKKDTITSYSLDSEIRMSMEGGAFIGMLTSIKSMDDRIQSTGKINMSGHVSNIHIVADANGTMWAETRAGTDIHVTKTEVTALQKMERRALGPSLGGGPETGTVQHPLDALAHFQKTYSLILGETGEIDGVPAILVKGTMSEKKKQEWLLAHPTMARSVASSERLEVLVGLNDLFPRRTRMFGRDGTVSAMTRTWNVQINPDLDESLFEYTPPKGATVVDLAERTKTRD